MDHIAVQVEKIELATEVEKRIALANVRIGSTLVRGIAVWRARNGHLRVYLPSYRIGRGFEDAVQLPDDILTDVETAVIAAYREVKAEAVDKPAEANLPSRP